MAAFFDRTAILDLGSAIDHAAAQWPDYSDLFWLDACNVLHQDDVSSSICPLRTSPPVIPSPAHPKLIQCCAPQLRRKLLRRTLKSFARAEIPGISRPLWRARPTKFGNFLGAAPPPLVPISGTWQPAWAPGPKGVQPATSKKWREPLLAPDARSFAKQ